ncbi:MAG: hypothetical protein ACFB21_10990 [Opitutales bacterium]
MSKALHPQFLVDSSNRRTAVLLSIEEWERIVDELEDLADVAAYRAAKQAPADPLPLEEALDFEREV